MAAAGNNERPSLIAKALGTDPTKSLDLRPKLRVSEQIIRFFLLACGVMSIFTTVGIVAVLGNESIAFFTRQMWENTNKNLYADIDATQTEFATRVGGKPVEEGQIIRFNDEIMLVESYSPNTINIEVTGTSAGFRRFCAGETDINNASRPITDAEIAACNENGINPVEFRVGTDALAVVVNSENDFVEDVTLDELAQIFGTAETWSDVRLEWPDEPIMRFIPGVDSGTYDYFTEVIFDEDAEALLQSDPVTSEDDNQLTRGVSENEFAVGFFGYAYYLNNQNSLKSVSVEGVALGADTAEDGIYPLARPLFIYSDPQIMRDDRVVAAFIDYYLTHVDEEIVDVGYFRASPEEIREAQEAWLSAMGEEIPADLEADEPLLPEFSPFGENGTVAIAGSSTVFPLTEQVAQRFQEDGFLPRLIVERGYQDTTPVAHNAGTTLFAGLRVSLVEFFTNTVWQPAIGEFGILPLINATLMTSTIAMLVSLPLGLGAAIYLSEYARPGVRRMLKPILEILAGIPTVVYGYFALTFMTPLLRALLGVEVVQVYNTASAGIVVGILIIPLVTSMSEDALHAVPSALREASYGLGANKLETTLQVVVPAALSGILAAFIVAVSRAIGETMIVAIAAGAGPNLTFNPFEGAETMTGHIARISGGDLSYDSIDYNSIFAIGLTLFLITLLLNIISRVVTNRFREEY